MLPWEFNQGLCMQGPWACNVGCPGEKWDEMDFWYFL